ncbi:GNAT family N-acetyltransferase [Actinocorallia sp. API 0066]|nr:GNAT family N-acetyltransferase [Actinocorallia sp. API 0066]
MAEFTSAARASEPFHTPWVYPPLTPGEFAAYLARLDGETSHGFVLRRASDGALVGYVNLTQIVRGSYQKATLGYAAFTGHERRGYMSEGLTLTIRHAFTTLALHRLEAEIQPANTASRRLAASLGFTYEGLARSLIRIRNTWHDHERWSRTADV